MGGGVVVDAGEVVPEGRRGVDLEVAIEGQEAEREPFDGVAGAASSRPVAFGGEGSVAEVVLESDRRCGEGEVEGHVGAVDRRHGQGRPLNPEQE